MNCVKWLLELVILSKMRRSKNEEKARNKCNNAENKKSRVKRTKLKDKQAELVARRQSIRTEKVASGPWYLVCGKVRMITPGNLHYLDLYYPWGQTGKYFLEYIQQST
jgi:hypothetical protein